MTEEDRKEYNELVKDMAKKFNESNEQKGVFPLTFWYKNEHQSEEYPVDYIINTRGTGFLYKTTKNYYIITARHNFDLTGEVLTDESIMSILNHLVVTKDLSHVNHITKDDLTDDNVVKFSYINLHANYEHDMCILRLIDNIPEDQYFFEDFELNLEIHDNAYLAGYPQELVDYTNNDCTLEVQKLILSLHNAGGYMTDYGLNPTYRFDKDSLEVSTLSGVSGGPIIHYNPVTKKFVVFGMCISEGKGLIVTCIFEEIRRIIYKFEFNNGLL